MSKETDYLFEMYKKYAPTKMVGNYECETDEGNKWLDNIIIVKKKLQAIEIIKKKGVNLYKLKMCNNVEEYNKLCNSDLPLTKEEYELLKEVIL